MHVARPLIDRALQIMHAFLTEAESRSYTAEPKTDLERAEAVHTLAIVIRGRAFPLVLTERMTKPRTNPPRKSSANKNAIGAPDCPSTTRSSTDASPSASPPDLALLLVQRRSATQGPD
ncbi:hypothetical protein ACFYN0_34915 [Streptomyces sp. NPDC006704]|uniref:hypothetical protein n=1 Tax=Streptomyces sp. NPDC006704 TaxID=3364760 RepID=UPI0036C6F013